jgi:hypothetical protein
MPILNYTTQIAASKTVGEIQAMLGKAGATRLMLDLEAGEPVALIFELQHRPFRLPCRHDEVFKVIKSDYSIPAKLRTPEQARRVAWRIIKDWTAAQLALIETGMVAAEEVFLPYQIVTQSGETVYEVYLRSDRMLPLQEVA